MNRRHVLAFAVALGLIAQVALAGSTGRLPVPTLGDLGLTLLGVGLVGSGLVSLRRRRTSRSSRQ